MVHGGNLKEQEQDTVLDKSWLTMVEHGRARVMSKQIRPGMKGRQQTASIMYHNLLRWLSTTCCKEAIHMGIQDNSQKGSKGLTFFKWVGNPSNWVLQDAKVLLLSYASCLFLDWNSQSNPTFLHLVLVSMSNAMGVLASLSPSHCQCCVPWFGHGVSPSQQRSVACRVTSEGIATLWELSFGRYALVSAQGIHPSKTKREKMPQEHATSCVCHFQASKLQLRSSLSLWVCLANIMVM